MSVLLAASILAADFSRLGEQVAEAELAGVDRIHADVMDGHFVPNISLGVPVVRALREMTNLHLETHLMITDPDSFLDSFAEVGSDTLLVHSEGNCNLHRTIQHIKSLGKRAGVAINPATPVGVLEAILPDLDQVLVMTVNPGFGNQKFLPGTLDKIRRIRQMIDDVHPQCELEVDGGINVKTAPLCVAAGANVFVSGTAVFADPAGIATAIRRLQQCTR